MKPINEYTKEELYAGLAAQTMKADCLQQEVERLYALAMKLAQMPSSSSKAEVRING